MGNPKAEKWKLVAWNGVSLRVPPQWEISSLATSYLQLEDGLGPVLEFKWQKVKGRFSHQNHLKKLAQHSRSKAGVNFRQTSLSEKWRQALDHFEVQAFEWQGAEIGGKGVVLYCPASQQASLLQFYHKRDRDDSMVQLEVLNSFRDSCKEDMVKWSLFGLQAFVPKQFELVRYGFQPGHYQLEFQGPRERIYLNRWGPADLLLRDGNLRHWFEERCREFGWGDLASIGEHSYHGKPALSGKSRDTNSMALRIWARIVRKLPNLWIRIWHLSSQNQILGVTARSLIPMDENLLEEICRNYDMA